MNIYTLAFLGVMGLMLLVALAALYFLSSEAGGRRRITARYDVVRTVDTDTIETVDQEGHQRRWRRIRR